jgi:hypothetical protein
MAASVLHALLLMAAHVLHAPSPVIVFLWMAALFIFLLCVMAVCFVVKLF